MKKRGLLSTLIFGTFLTLFASNVLAGTITSGGPSAAGVFQPIIEGVNNSVGWMQFEGLTDILIWLVVPALGIYAIFRFIFGKSFEYAERNFKENSGLSRDNLSDMAEWSARVLAGTVSIITVIQWGGVFGSLIILAGLAGLVTFIWHVVAGTRGNLMPHPFGGDNPVSDGGTQTQNPPSAGSGPSGLGTGSEGIPDEVDERMSSMESVMSDLESSLSDLESETSTVASDLQQLAREVEDLEQFRQRLSEMVDQGKLTSSQAKKVEELIEEAESLEQLEEDIEQNEEHILQNEEKIEQNEEKIAELEKQIGQLEQKTEQDLSQIRQELNQLKQQRDTILGEIESLQEQLNQGAINRQKYEQERQQLQTQLQTVQQEVVNIQNELGQAQQERQQIRSNMQQLLSAFEGIESEVSANREMIEEVKQEEKKGEKMEQDEEKKESEFQIPEEWDKKLVGFITDEKEQLKEEEKETQDLSHVEEGMEWLLEAEEEEAKEEEAISERIDKEFAKLAQAAEQLEMSVKEETEAVEEVDQQEQQRVQEEVATGKEAGELANEAKQIAGDFPADKEQNAIRQAKESFDDAGQVWLNPNKQKSIDQVIGWIWAQQEVLEQLEQVKQNHKGDQQRIQEAQRLEEGLVHIINTICEKRGIERGQFGFLQ